MPFTRYNIQDYVTDMDVTITDQIENHKERNKFGGFWYDLKTTVYKWHYYNGFFDSIYLTPNDEKHLVLGCSPIIKTSKDSKPLFSLHHIVPLNCGGKTIASNLVPLPHHFHEFIHNKIINPQINHLQVGDTAKVVGTPDFTKIPLNLMFDKSFMIQYHKFVVDKYHVIPNFITKAIKENRNPEEVYNQWYKRSFYGLEKE